MRGTVLSTGSIEENEKGTIIIKVAVRNLESTKQTFRIFYKVFSIKVEINKNEILEVS